MKTHKESQIELLSLLMDDRKIDAFEASQYLVAMNPFLNLEQALDQILEYRGL